ncbi:hypothetical protein B0H14DRAFT_2605512 [Mycena olivaceomarginata]|nr:hypothetical protein B0H14DRAFT_2605512 [Mycena olivaceomarginata]
MTILEFVEFAFNQPHQSSSSMAGIQYANVGVCIQVILVASSQSRIVYTWKQLAAKWGGDMNVSLPRGVPQKKDTLHRKSLSEGRTSGTGENLKSGKGLACGYKHLIRLGSRGVQSAWRALANKVRQMEDPRVNLPPNWRVGAIQRIVSNAQAHVSRLEKILGQTYPTPPEIAQYCFDDSEMGSCRLPQDTGREPERELSAAFGSYGISTTVLQNPLGARVIVTGVREKVYVPPHWLAVHDEIHVVLKGRVIVTQDGVRHVSAPKTVPALPGETSSTASSPVHYGGDCDGA